MKNRKIFNLIGLAVIVLLLGLGIWKFNDVFIISLDGDKLISCREHVDRNEDMLCDLCHSNLPFSNYAENKSVEALGSDDSKVEIKGYMPKSSQASVTKLDENQAILTAKKYRKDISDEDIVAGFDISIDSGNIKYQPKEYSQNVDVKISNLNLDLSKTYALLHIIDEENFEVLPVNSITENELTFTTGSFSTYIVITVGTNAVTFDGANFKVFDLNGDEIVGDATVADSTKFSFNIVPNKGYGVTAVTCSTTDGFSVTGDIKGRTCYIASVSADLTITVTTAAAPTITAQPTSVKVTKGGTATFSLTASNATSYQWQYRTSANDYWQNASTSATYKPTVTVAMSGYEYRCLVGNASFTNYERVVSDIVILTVVDGEYYTYAQKIPETPPTLPVITTQPTSVKVTKGGKATFTVTATGATTYQWQYRANEDDYWHDANSSSSTAAYSVTATVAMSGYQYRCLVGNSDFTGHQRVKSDIVSLSVFEGEYSTYARVLGLRITAQPESQKVKLGQSVTFSITAENVGTYKWYYLLSGDTYWTEITSSMSSTYNKASMTIGTSSMSVDENLQLVNSMSGAKFKCVISDDALTDYTIESDTAILSVAQDQANAIAEVIQTTSPEDVTVYEGQSASFTAGIQNVSGVIYEWHEVNGDVDTVASYTGANTATLTIPGNLVTSAKNGFKYYCNMSTASNTAGGIKTDMALLTVKSLPNVSDDDVTVTIASRDYVYSGTAYTPAVTVSKAGTPLTLNVDYTVEYSNNINATKFAYITINGKGAYSGTRSETFSISRKNVEVVWQDVSSFEYDGTAHAPTASATGVNGETLTLQVNGAQTNFGTGYTATAVISSVTGGQANAENYSLSNAEKTFSISQRALKIKAGSASKTYDGEELSWQDVDPAYTADGLLTGHTAEVTRSGGITKVGTVSHTIDSVVIKSGADDVTANYLITTENGLLTVNAASEVTFGVTFTGENEFTYDGTEHKPAVSITANGKALKENVDYTLSYDDNVDASESAKVIVTGINNYEGSNGNATFKINKRNITITAKSMEKEYDGSLLIYSHISEPRYTVEPADGILAGDVLTVVTSGQILNAGEEPHAIQSYSITRDGAVSTNYNVTTVNGVLKITSASISATVEITGTAKTHEKVTAVVTVEPDDCKPSYSWWYQEPGSSTKTTIEGATDSTFKIKDKNLIGKIVGVTVTFTRLNYTDLVVSAQMSRAVLEGQNKNVLMERKDEAYIIGAKRASEETSDDSYLNYTADKVKSIQIIDLEATSAPVAFAASWDISQDYGTELVTAWIAASGSDYVLYIGSEGATLAYSGNKLFSNYSNCTSITGLNNLDTSEATSMTNMFAGCTKLATLDVESLSTKATSSMEGMFKGCAALTALNVSNFRTIRVTSMKEMFAGCSGLQGIDVKDFRTVNVNDMSAMFKGCSNLTAIDVSGFDTTNVENFASMFSGCSKLSSINVKNFSVASAKSLGGMFKDCKALTTLELTSFSTLSLNGSASYTSIDGVDDKNLNFMFDGCTNLATIVLGKNFARIDGTNMFRNCTALERIIAQSETAMTLSNDTGISALKNAKIYVPKNANVSGYSAAANYQTQFGTERIKPMLEVLGDNPTNVVYGEAYSDAGVKVAGYTEAQKAEYEKLGYTLTTTGLPINTNQIGEYHVIYTLKYSTQIVDTAQN